MGLLGNPDWQSNQLYGKDCDGMGELTVEPRVTGPDGQDGPGHPDGPPDARRHQVDHQAAPTRTCKNSMVVTATRMGASRQYQDQESKRSELKRLQNEDTLSQVRDRYGLTPSMSCSAHCAIDESYSPGALSPLGLPGACQHTFVIIGFWSATGTGESARSTRLSAIAS